MSYNALNSNKQISLIIPCLNDSVHLEVLLAKIARKTPILEIIVVDGGSVDNSVEIAEKYSNLVIKTAKGRAH